ncbi:MAG: hypothetical protein CMI12_10045 [Oceanospirillum sp.]|nr:hypothetical protein [Oceanospirillum sp.]
MATVSEQIQQVYIGLLGRAADLPGLEYWKQEIEQGALSLEQLRANIVNEQPEYATGLGALSRASVIVELYSRMFNRVPASNEVGYWAEEGGSTVDIDLLVFALVNGADQQDSLVLSMKTAAAEQYTNAAGDNYDPTAATDAVKDVGLSVPGITVAFTDADATGAADEYQGTDNNDFFSATGGIENSDATLDSEDTLADNNLNDEDILSITSATDIIEMASLISGIETINISLSSSIPSTINLDGIVGFGTTINVTNAGDSASDSVLLLNVPGDVKLITGDKINTVSAMIEGKDAVLDLSAATNIQLQNLDENDVTIITSDGAQVSLDGTSGRTDSVTLQSTGTVSIESEETDQVEILKLSGNNGDVLYLLDSEGYLPTEVVFSGSSNITLGLTLDQVTGLSSLDTSSSLATTTIRLLSGGTGDFSNLNVDFIEFASAEGAGTYSLSQRQGILLSSDLGSAITFDTPTDGAADSINISVAASQTGSIDVSDFEVINLSSVSNAVELSALTGSESGSIVNISGSQNVTLASITAQGVNANHLTGNLTITQSELLTSMTGGSGDDTFTIVGGDFALDAGSGTDALLFTDTLDLSANTIDIINVEKMQITADAAASVTLNSSELDNKPIILSGTGEKDTFIINMDESSLNLSSLNVDSDTVSISINGADLTTRELTIVGSGVGDVITGNSSDDTLTPGEGADRVSGLGGDDMIDLAESEAAADIVVLSSVNVQGVDSIDSFNVQNDIIAWQNTDLTAESNVPSGSNLQFAYTDTALISAGGSTFTLGASSSEFSIVELNTTLDDDIELTKSSTGSDLLQALSEDSTPVSGIQVNAADDKVGLISYQNNNAYLWHLEQSGSSDALVMAEDIQLVAVLYDVGQGELSSSNFIVA